MAEIGRGHVMTWTPQESHGGGRLDSRKIGKRTGETRIADSDGQMERVLKEQSKPVGKLGIVAERADLGSLDNLREPPPTPKLTREFQQLDPRE